MTSAATNPQSSGAAAGSASPVTATTSGGEISPDHRALVGEQGKTSIADIVVAKIAGIAAREIDGVHALGGQTARLVGRVRDAIPGGTQSITQGISVEVGEKQAAVDLSFVAEYGVAIHELAAAVRSNVVTSIEQMTSLEVTEVNISVYDVHFEDDASETPAEPRVQ